MLLLLDLKSNVIECYSVGEWAVNERLEGNLEGNAGDDLREWK